MIGGGASSFFRVSETEDHRAARLHAALEQRLHGLEQAEYGTLVVERAASPDVAVGDVSGKRAVPPILLGSRLDRHNVLMAHQKHWRERRIAAAPRIQQGARVDELATQSRLDQRIRS